MDNADNFTDVSYQLGTLALCYLIQSWLTFAFAFYQVCSILMCKSLFKIRMIISILNKIVIVYLVSLLVVTQVFMFGEEGKLCTGDELTEIEMNDSSIADKYMIDLGHIYEGYIIAVYAFLGISILVGLLMAYLLMKAFS